MASARNRRSRRPTQQIKTPVLIVCEGRRTELDYFNALGNYDPVKGRYATDVTYDSNAIEKAIELKNQRREDETSYACAWVVVDVEGQQRHSHFKKWMGKASAASIVLCFSNPSFEYWLLLHLENTCACFENAAKVKACLDAAWQKAFGHEYSKTDRKIFERLMPQMKTAVKRANSFWNGAAYRSCPSDPLLRNSSTGVQGIVAPLLGMRKLPCQSTKFAHQTATPPPSGPCFSRHLRVPLPPAGRSMLQAAEGEGMSDEQSLEDSSHLARRKCAPPAETGNCEPADLRDGDKIDPDHERHAGDCTWGGLLLSRTRHPYMPNA